MEVEVDVLGSGTPNRPYGLCGRKATLRKRSHAQSSGAVCKRRRTLAPVLNSPYGLGGRKATMNKK